MDDLDQILKRKRRIRAMPPPGMRRALRVSAGLSQAELGEILDVSAPTVCRWETGERDPRGDVAGRYLDVLERLQREAV